MKEVFEMKEAKELLMQEEGLLGVRTFVASFGNSQLNKLTPPPHFGEHTEEVVSLYK